MVTRHQLLAMLHEVVKPELYLEIGVHTGDSLRLADASRQAIGIDPHPLMRDVPESTRIFSMTSDEFFDRHDVYGMNPFMLQLAFIDGMHLAEFALRDFINIERNGDYQTIVVFDDVLPRNQEEAAREQCPGDWTGDVWRVYYALKTWRPDLQLRLVDTAPTGTLVVWNLDDDAGNTYLAVNQRQALRYTESEPVPGEILQRTWAIDAQLAVDSVRKYLEPK